MGHNLELLSTPLTNEDDIEFVHDDKSTSAPTKRAKRKRKNSALKSSVTSSRHDATPASSQSSKPQKKAGRTQNPLTSANHQKPKPAAVSRPGSKKKAARENATEKSRKTPRATTNSGETSASDPDSDTSEPYRIRNVAS